MKILILGGGISGLTAAWTLQKKYPHASITLLEKSDRLGGCIDTLREGSAVFEKGPRTCVDTRSPSLLALIQELGMESELIYASPDAKKRYLYTDGKLRTPFSLFPKMILPLLREPFRAPSLAEDESIYDFASRRFNPALANTFFDPMTLGIFAGDIHKLSLRSSFPFLHQWEQTHGSLLRALWRRPRTPSRLFTLQRGLSSLITTLAQKISADIYLDTPVLAIERKGVVTPNRFWEADHIISALPAPIIGRLTNLWPNFSTASIWVVNLTFPPNALSHSGFGYLVPTQEKEPLLGAIFDSSLFPQPDRKTRLTAMLRPQGDASWATAAALSSLRRHLNLSLAPLSVTAHLAQEAIPQFEVGYAKKLAQFREQIQSDFPHLTLVGNYLEGPSLDNCVKVASKKNL